MKATIIVEAWNERGDFVGQVLVENAAETWRVVGTVCFPAPGGGHSKATIKAALKDYALAHTAQCAADLAKPNVPGVKTIDAINDDTTEVPISNEARRLRKLLADQTP